MLSSAPTKPAVAAERQAELLFLKIRSPRPGASVGCGNRVVDSIEEGTRGATWGTSTVSAGTSVRAKRTCGAPQPGQNAELSSTGDPQRWQGCSTLYPDYRISGRSGWVITRSDGIVL